MQALFRRYEELIETYAADEQKVKMKISVSTKDIAKVALPATLTPSIVAKAENVVDILVNEPKKSQVISQGKE